MIRMGALNPEAKASGRRAIDFDCVPCHGLAQRSGTSVPGE